VTGKGYSTNGKEPGSAGMKVSIEFFGTQRVIAKTDRIDMTITEDATVSDVLEYVKRRYHALQLDEGMVIVTVNKQIASLDRVLSTGDTVSFLPFISGG
jgi:molybdopterin converting factor small subunit